MSYKTRQQEKQYITLVCIPMAYVQVFNDTVITYRYFNVLVWDKDHSTQNEMAIPII